MMRIGVFTLDDVNANLARRRVQKYGAQCELIRSPTDLLRCERLDALIIDVDGLRFYHEPVVDPANLSCPLTVFCSYNEVPLAPRWRATGAQSYKTLKAGLKAIARQLWPRLKSAA